MPSRDEHLSKARKNREFADLLKPDNSTRAEWKLTVLFYSALHYVEAFHAKTHLHCKRHQDLNDNIMRNPLLADISEDYFHLQNFSWNARYQAVNYGNAEVEEAIQCHAAIAKHVTDLIAGGH